MSIHFEPTVQQPVPEPKFHFQFNDSFGVVAESVFQKKYEVLKEDWIQGEEKPKKRKLSGNASSRDAKKTAREVPRSGAHIVAKKSPSIATLKQDCVDIGVVTWNINHFEKAEAKKQAIHWLFRNHRWLDVLVLQEINETGRGEMEQIIQSLNQDETFLWPLAIEFGPKFQSVSSVKKVDEDTVGKDIGNEEDQEEEGAEETGDSGLNSNEAEEGEDSVLPTEAPAQKLTILGETIVMQKIPGKKRFRVCVKNKAWTLAQPSQMEYYAIVYRNWKVENCCAFYKNAPETGYQFGKPQEEPLYWSKTTDVPLTDIAPKLFAKKEEEMEGSLPKAVQEFAKETLEKFALPAFLTCSHAQTTRKKKAAWTRRWTLGSATGLEAGEVYVIYEKVDGTFGLYWRTEIVPANYRPIVLYQLKSPREGHIVNLGVVHTTPAGHKLNRLKEYEQVRGAFQHASESGGFWILAGDYYLDLEARARPHEKETSRRKELFETVVSEQGLEVAISVSATNQSRVRKPVKPKDTVYLGERPGKKVGETVSLYVVNKRADFFVHTPTFTFTYAGLICPRGGIILYDPGHNALNYWSTISDHCPVGGIFSEYKETSARWLWYTQEEEKLANQTKGRLEEVYTVINNYRDRAENDLVYALAKLDEVDFFSTLGKGLMPQTGKRFKVPELVVTLCALIEGVLIAEFQWEASPKSNWRKQKISPDLDKVGDLRNFLEYLWTKRTDLKKAKTYTDNKEAMDSFFAIAQTAHRAMNLLGFEVKDFDLTSSEDYTDVNYQGGQLISVPQGMPLPKPQAPQNPQAPRNKEKEEEDTVVGEEYDAATIEFLSFQ